MKPFITGICPTYRHPELLANCLAMWLDQDYPSDRCLLIILDDDQTFEDQGDDNWVLRSASNRYNSLPEKYNALLSMIPQETDIVAIIEDDDLYFPQYLSTHQKALEEKPFSKPSIVLSDYPGNVITENGAGRFHSSMTFSKELIISIGGWPNTKRADFDQQLISKLTMFAGEPADPCRYGPPQFLYRWHSGAAHGQSTMRSPDDEEWYDRSTEAYMKVSRVGKLVPQYDNRALNMLNQFKQERLV